jgi:hypothetical protein
MKARRKRRPDDGRFMPKDALTWRRLIAAARRAARNPAKYGVDVGAKAGRAVKAVMPPGHAHRDSVFVQLILKARLFWAAPGERQAELGPELERLADDCARALEVGDERRSPPERKDIYG